MNWLTILKIVLQLAAFFARRADRRDIEKAVANEIEILQGKRVRAARDAYDAVISGRVPANDSDPNRRRD